ncbi:carboxylating nicotinate-nucleotide diphosphorylase [Shouchella clausii]|uniref:carboxylating nicotinate-nucleotide diphosphorylase n=1 Tax=Shouchella TaxID=2893057 RepID=UPI0004E764C8|nr:MULTISPECIES: carboxylating nicotinate-nucleotide diphosphorylase [Shouchella]ALA51299.1 Quinolinate phosphoribosyltransferase [Shouchella clausii]MBU3232714.1 carboxylating nicotinate-nucleotide diphosphorylase [Shouchella clausii]MBU3265611.1 carboxylating nicotinate-nucleotide diphosphorylase [Shouchella clausii]MBU3508560.1 carboxylating nicotinate-nucleotide diphosphorylase [Shouchella clausii]MBU3535520.1 carboxylating nicotinate-nucleotide diphosphorylase [Shouchella clausii]
MNPLKLDQQLRGFLAEDIGYGDRTAEALFTVERAEAVIVAKGEGIFAGTQVVNQLYALLDSDIEVELFVCDGEQVKRGQQLARFTGPVKSLLSGERVLLNLLQRMCGIATLTAKAVEELGDPSIRVCDTRKTAPGLRMFDKFAVRIGGGANHRFGLDDALMLKENHIAACTSIAAAIEKARAYAGPMAKIEVETTTLDEVKEAVAAQADVIMFDNATPEAIRTYLAYVPAGIKTEASGGITMANLRQFANTGVDFLSLGFLTHSVVALDLSMLIQKGEEQCK